MAAIEQLAKEYEAARQDPGFTGELNGLLKNVCRPPDAGHRGEAVRA